jgi:NAD(P)-dependent dehydrogenase (short-subunit alcohol dehydrogenase family)
MTSRVALVTGATSGIGEAAARALRDEGFTVYAAGRRIDRLAALAGERMIPLALDVTDDESRIAAIERIVGEHGRIDLLVNNAGYGSLGAIEDTGLDEGRRQFEVNVFGPFRLIQLVLPHMRAQRGGRIINVSSIGGKVYSPLGGWYHGTKFALEGMSDSLRLEVAPFGIDVSVIEPGAIATEWGPIAADNVERTSGDGAYAAVARAVGLNLRSTSRKSSAPAKVVADAIVAAATARRPKTRYAVGTNAKPALIARRILTDRAFDVLALRTMGGADSTQAGTAASARR